MFQVLQCWNGAHASLCKWDVQETEEARVACTWGIIILNRLTSIIFMPRRVRAIGCRSDFRTAECYMKNMPAPPQAYGEIAESAHRIPQPGRRIRVCLVQHRYSYNTADTVDPKAPVHVG